MFERYSERARRVIFFARYETSRYGGKTIETEHLLLGLLREDAQLLEVLLHRPDVYSDIQARIETRVTTGERVPTSADLPLSEECQRILGYANEEAERLSHRFIGTSHLLLGILREKGCLAEQLLAEAGLTLDAAREVVAKSEDTPDSEPSARVDRSPIHALVDKVPPDHLGQLKILIENLLSDLPLGGRRISSVHGDADSSIIAETRQSIGPHQIYVKEQFHWDPSGNTLRYTHEVTGPLPEQRHSHSFDFDLP
jgi:hypothetical protein